MIVKIGFPQTQREFVDYLLRLGCTVTRLDEETLEVSVTYPETVADEEAELAEWCRIWASARGTRLELAPAAAAA